MKLCFREVIGNKLEVYSDENWFIGSILIVDGDLCFAADDNIELTLSQLKQIVEFMEKNYDQPSKQS